ncbi:radical SAM protein, partial [Faecalibacterium sp. DFI.5.82]|nr:radical SAM protein [Faecalibacterium sp. DFI.5.82]
LPIVCNTGGYDTVESVHARRGFIDNWLADLKYVSPALSAELSAAPDYFAQARPAIEAMMSQAGHTVFDSEGILQRGVILRHLALPGHVDDSFAVLDQMAAWNKA